MYGSAESRGQHQGEHQCRDEGDHVGDGDGEYRGSVHGGGDTSSVKPRRELYLNQYDEWHLPETYHIYIHIHHK